MWDMLPSMAEYVQYFRPVFTNPSFVTHCCILVSWLMSCCSTTVLLRVFLRSRAGLHNFGGSHGCDRYYNFFERSVWDPITLGQRLFAFVLTRLPRDGSIPIITDDTILHKRGFTVWGLGWFRDAVASTQTRVATASAHNWVVLALAYRIPCTKIIVALPLFASLHTGVEGSPSCADLACKMIQDLLKLYPDKHFLLLADGGYTNGNLLDCIDELGDRLHYIGRLRSDAAIYDPIVPKQPKGKRGRKPNKGPKLPTPAQMAKQAVPPGKEGEYQWQEVKVTLYGKEKIQWAFSRVVVWYHVLGLRRVRVVVIRDPEGVMEDCYLLVTDLEMSLEEIIEKYSWRWTIEVMFRASKQQMDIQGPQHYCEESVNKVAPWVWSLQTVVTLWYVEAGHLEPEAKELRDLLGPWDSEWSLAHMLRVFRRATINAKIKATSGCAVKLQKLAEDLRDWIHLAA